MLKRVDPTVWAALALGGWSVFVLNTTYLDPLPSRSEVLGARLLVVAGFGAGLLSGWRARTWLVLFELMALGVLHLAPVANDERDSQGVVALLFIAPIALGIGALASKVSSRTHAVGAALLALPLVIVAWAGFRDARPIDHHPKQPLVIDSRQRAEYRGLHYGDERRRVLEVLGRPDSIVAEASSSFSFKYGRDAVVLTNDRVEIFDIADPSAETPKGVGIGDNLALVSQRFAGMNYRCQHASPAFEPKCRSRLGRSFLIIEGDPIHTILMWPGG